MCVCVCCYYSKTRVPTTVRFRSARTRQCYRYERSERLEPAVRGARTVTVLRLLLCVRVVVVVLSHAGTSTSSAAAEPVWRGFWLGRNIVRGCPPPSLLRSSRRQPAVGHHQIKKIPFYLFTILFLGSRRHDIIICIIFKFQRQLQATHTRPTKHY